MKDFNNISRMFPDLSYILHFLIGTEPDNFFSIIKSFGLMLAAAFLVGAWLLQLELKRKEKEGLLIPIEEEVSEKKYTTGSYVFNIILGFIIGFKLLFLLFNSSETTGDLAGFLISSTGNSLGGLIGGIAGYFITKYFASKEPADVKSKKVLVYPHQRVADITFLAAISGIAGAKLFAIFESRETFASFLSNPIDTIFSGSGLAIYGGLILAFFIVYSFLKKKKMQPIHVMDAVAPSLIIGYGVGRMGCQLSGDGDWGIPNTNPKPGFLSWLPDRFWAFDYPHNVLNEGMPIPDCTWDYCMKLATPVYPTPVYETILAFIIGGILWSLRKRIKIPGVLFFLYVFLNGVERFWIEKIRVNDKINFLGMELTQAEIISSSLIVIGLVGIIYLVNDSKKKSNI